VPHLAFNGMVVDRTSGPFISLLNFSFMRSNENQPTKAEAAFLQFVSTTDPDTLYHSLSDTLGLSISNFTRHYLEEAMRSAPTEHMLEQWLLMLQLLEHLHALALADAGGPAGRLKSD